MEVTKCKKLLKISFNSKDEAKAYVNSEFKKFRG
jgi:hypothetical protein